MEKINLAYPELGTIQFKKSNFPDGQQDITINTIFNERSPVLITSRLNSFLDLELIVCTTAALRGMGVKEIQLSIPYILGARSDRQFVSGGTSYLRDVVAPIINAQKFDCVYCIDAHSDVASAVINNLEVKSNEYLVAWAIAKIQESEKSEEFPRLISPDAGALKKIYKLSEKMNYNDEIIVCSKHRDDNGRLSKVKVPLDDSWDSTRSAIIIDDICDGGATFINIAKEFQANNFKGKLYLIVTHGIFSKGIKELSEYFENIFCTNSYGEIPKSTNYKGADFEEDFVKYLDILK